MLFELQEPFRILGHGPLKGFSLCNLINSAMGNKIFIGIDVSKATLDVFIHNIGYHFVVTNNSKGFVRIIQTIWEKLPSDKRNVFFCFEDTGKYSLHLAVFLTSESIPFAMVSSIEIKRSMGLVRGKSDKKDAKMIALYAWRKRDELTPTVLPPASIVQMKHLLSLRDKLVTHRRAYQSGIKDIKDFFADGDTTLFVETQKRLIEQLNREITAIEAKIEAIIGEDAQLKDSYRLIKTAPGVGRIVAYYLLAYTHNFTKFKDARKFACYCGIAPFEYRSGTSIKGRTRLNPMANKMIKGLLNMAAMSCMQNYTEFKDYYAKRTEKGYNKMSTLNVIRNKIVFRVFAVISRRTEYVDVYKFAA